MCQPNLTSVALSVSEIIGGTLKHWAVAGYATLPFLQNFWWAFVRMDPVNVPTKFEVRSFTCFWDNSGYYLKTLGSPWIRRSRSSKVTDFGANRKCVCDFLLVRHSNLGPILHHFGDIAGFLCSGVTQLLFHPNFRGVLVAPDRPWLGQPGHKT